MTAKPATNKPGNKQTILEKDISKEGERPVLLLKVTQNWVICFDPVAVWRRAEA